MKELKFSGIASALSLTVGLSSVANAEIYGYSAAGGAWEYLDFFALTGNDHGSDYVSYSEFGVGAQATYEFWEYSCNSPCVLPLAGLNYYGLVPNTTAAGYVYGSPQLGPEPPGPWTATVCVQGLHYSKTVGSETNEWPSDGGCAILWGDGFGSN